MPLLGSQVLHDLSSFQNLPFFSVVFGDSLQHAAENICLRRTSEVEDVIKGKRQLAAWPYPLGFISAQLQYLWDIGWINHVELPSLCCMSLYYLAMQC